MFIHIHTHNLFLIILVDCKWKYSNSQEYEILKGWLFKLVEFYNYEEHTERKAFYHT